MLQGAYLTLIIFQLFLVMLVFSVPGTLVVLIFFSDAEYIYFIMDN